MENYFDSQELEDLLFRELFNKLLEEKEKDKNEYIYVVNPKVLNNLKEVYMGMKKIFERRDAEVRYSVGELDTTFGYVEVISNCFNFNSEQKQILEEAVSMCCSFDLMPRTDDRFTMDFGFKNVLIRRKIKKETL